MLPLIVYVSCPVKICEQTGVQEANQGKGAASLTGHQDIPYLMTTPFAGHNHFTARKWPSYYLITILCNSRYDKSMIIDKIQLF